MPSLEIQELAEKINQFSVEDKQWLLQQLSQNLNTQEAKKEEITQKQQAREIILETLVEALSLPDNYYEEVWQRFESVCTKISQENFDQS